MHARNRCGEVVAAPTPHMEHRHLLATTITSPIFVAWHCAGPQGLNDGVVKGLGTSWQGMGATRVSGMYLSADDDGMPNNTQALGRDGLRIGDGFHDYLL